MWRDHPFSQRNKITERTVRVGLEATGKWGRGWAWTKFEKRGEWGGNIGGAFIK